MQRFSWSKDCAPSVDAEPEMSVNRHSIVLFVVVGQQVFADAILPFQPSAQIDPLATFSAKRQPLRLVVRIVEKLSPALRTFRSLCCPRIKHVLNAHHPATDAPTPLIEYDGAVVDDVTQPIDSLN